MTRERQLEHLGYIWGFGVINALLIWPKMFQGEMF